MPNYLVTMPVTGFVSREVEADDEAAAVEAFLASDASPREPDACQFTEHVVRGGRSHALQNDVQVQCVGDGARSAAQKPINIRVSPWVGAQQDSGPETVLDIVLA